MLTTAPTKTGPDFEIPSTRNVVFGPARSVVMPKSKTPADTNYGLIQAAQSSKFGKFSSFVGDQDLNLSFMKRDWL